jgi:hypothetical protein
VSNTENQVQMFSGPGFSKLTGMPWRVLQSAFQTQGCRGMGYEARRSAQQWQARASYAAPSGGVEHVALVAGGGRGLGLEYVRQLLKRPQQRWIPVSP